MGTNSTILKGTPWTVMEPPNPFLTLNCIWGSAGNNIYAGGKETTDGRILLYNGTSWGIDYTFVGSGSELKGIWGADASNVYAAGSSSSGYAVVLKRAGANNWVFSYTSNPTSATFYGIWGYDNSNMYAWGLWPAGEGRVARFNGSIWTGNDFTDSSSSIYGVWGPDAANIYAAGVNDTGGVVYKRGTGTMGAGNWGVFKQFTAGDAVSLHSIWGTSSSDIFVSCYDGKVVHYDGSTWSITAVLGAGYDLLSIWGISATDVYSVSRDGHIIRYNP
ncbi:MAG: hypothetical protein RDV48_28885 [Candidatus Eremiobacteraeota bacterium]|nr:hypothetical protein [Candidatus Eremiobacteraeota bacterium]